MFGELFGPLFRYEAGRAIKNPAILAVRIGLPLAVLVAAATAHAAIYSTTQIPYRDVPEFREAFKDRFLVPTLTLLLWVGFATAPALFAATVARDREARIRDLILSAHVSPFGWIFLRWWARFATIAFGFAAALPAFLWASVYGAARPEEVAAGLAVVFASLLALSALAVLASTAARTTREAIAAAYVIPALVVMAPGPIGFVFDELTSSKSTPAWVFELRWQTAACIDRYVLPHSAFERAMGMVDFTAPSSQGQTSA
ncbi:MAG TPA: ABC transporter permease, partial [Planctomycetia bacterium]|nr:ABC transporter permease [Planctomycetia bacterium]